MASDSAAPGSTESRLFMAIRLRFRKKSRLFCTPCPMPHSASSGLGPGNGIEALELARKHRPDLILMDIQLPEVSGLEVTKRLKDDPELKAIPVVAVTAFAM